MNELGCTAKQAIAAHQLGIRVKEGLRKQVEGQRATTKECLHKH